MKTFSGFPAGKLQVTPLPNLFFSELCPAIDDLGELKVTLHILWLLAHSAKSAGSGDKKGPARYISANELRGDRTLMQSLAAGGAKPDEALGCALASAVERGTLLHLSVADESGAGDDLYFLNSEAGRRAFEKFDQVQLRRGGSTPEPAAVGERPNIFALYEQNIGLLTPMISEELKEAEQQYPAEWIQDAFKIAVENNKRSWSYTRKILERWKAEGRTPDSKKRKHWWGDEYDKYINR
jgi:DnaD/phage-associated family protein